MLPKRKEIFSTSFSAKLLKFSQNNLSPKFKTAFLTTSKIHKKKFPPLESTSKFHSARPSAKTTNNIKVVQWFC